MLSLSGMTRPNSRQSEIRTHVGFSHATVPAAVWALHSPSRHPLRQHDDKPLENVNNIYR